MMAKTPLAGPGEHDRPRWLPWSVFPFQIRLTDIDEKRVCYIDEGSGPALLLVSAGQWSFMFRDVILPARAVPLLDSGLPRQRAVTGCPLSRPQHPGEWAHRCPRPAGHHNDGPRCRRAAWLPDRRQAAAMIPGAGDQQHLRLTAGRLPVGAMGAEGGGQHAVRRYGWQNRFQQIFPDATVAGIDDGHHFPFNDDPDAYSAAISAWWAEKVTAAGGKFTTSSQESIR
jgi:hypothetical protein